MFSYFAHHSLNPAHQRREGLIFDNQMGAGMVALGGEHPSFVAVKLDGKSLPPRGTLPRREKNCQRRQCGQKSPCHCFHCNPCPARINWRKVFPIKAAVLYSHPSLNDTIIMFLQQENPKDRLYRKVFRIPENGWILHNKYALRCIQVLFDALPSPSLKYLSGRELFFIRSDGILASTVAPRKNCHIIIIYPKLLGMMKSAAPLCATAVLAHELGHIVLEHSARKMDPTAAQIEADHFVAQMGLGRELHQVLLDYEGTPDYPERIQALSQWLLNPH